MRKGFTCVRAAGLGVLALFGVVAGAAPSASAAVNTGRFSLLLGNDITTAYFFRGILQERDGFITQPYVEIGVKLHEEEDAIISGVSLFGGTWNSIHSERTGASASPEVLYETDWYGGLQVTILKNLVTRLFYTAYTSPNDAFKTVQEWALSFAYDDSALLGAWAMKPTVVFAKETDNTAFGPDEGTYAEIGVGPGLTLIQSETYPVTLTIPLKVGLSIDDYYENAEGKNSSLGYFSSGLKLSFPLAFIPEDYGTWSASGGVTFLALGTNTGDLNGSDFWTVGTWGISMTY